MCLTQTMPHTLLVKTHKRSNTERFLSCSWEPQASWVPSPSRRFSHRLLFLTCSCLVFSLCHSCTDLHTVAPRALCCCKGINSPRRQHCPSAPTPGGAAPQPGAPSFHQAVWLTPLASPCSWAARAVTAPRAPTFSGCLGTSSPECRWRPLFFLSHLFPPPQRTQHH